MCFGVFAITNFLHIYAENIHYEKTLLYILVFVGFTLSATAQEKEKTTAGPATTDAKKSNPTLYLAIGTGINNNTGILGGRLSYYVLPNFGIEAGAGLSSWGTKTYVGCKYFLKPNHLGTALGVGITHNSGLNNYVTSMETKYSVAKEDVTFDLKPQTNFQFSLYSYWRLGKKNGRINMQIGYSVRMSSESWVQKAGDPISSKSEDVMNIIVPGGIILGLGFSFPLN